MLSRASAHMRPASNPYAWGIGGALAGAVAEASRCLP